MPVFEAVTEFTCPPAMLFDFLVQSANAVRVMPPDLNARLIEGPERVELGSRVSIEMRSLGMRQVLTISVVAFEPERLLTDAQMEGPFRAYLHERHLTPVEGGVRIKDRIAFEPPRGLLGLMLSASRLRDAIADMHAHRVQAIRAILTPDSES